MRNFQLPAFLFCFLFSLFLALFSTMSRAAFTGTNETVSADTLCNNGTIEKMFVGSCRGVWSDGPVPTLTSHLGTQPAGTESPGDPNLVYDFNAQLESAYQGFFGMGNNTASHPELAGNTYSGVIYNDIFASAAGAFAFHPVHSDRFFYSGADGAWNGDGGFTGVNAGRADSIAEFTIPTLINPSDVNNRSGANEASQIQPWASVFNPDNGYSGTDTGHTITSLYYDRSEDKLCMQIAEQYDVGPSYNTNNLVCHTNPGDLSTENWQGYYQLGATSGNLGPTDGEANHVAAWMFDIPDAHQASLGGPVGFGGGANFSIISRSSTGPTLFAGSLTGIASSGAINLTRHMDFWDNPGQQMGAYLYPERPYVAGNSWYQHEYMNCNSQASPYNCGNSTTETNEIVAWINDWFNILSYGAQGFIMPGTDTYVVLGTMDAGEGGASYKGYPPWRGSRCTGPCRAIEDDQYNKYWLFDIKDILAAANPWEVFPYEHGYIPFLDQFQTRDGGRSRLVNAGFDLATGRLAIVMRNRYGGTEPKADILMFQSNAWMEAP